MVGIPRSKGCATCRRRKIRCDLGRPGCGNCAKVSRTCEGYQHYPIFLNRTLDGPARRSHLEETKEAHAEPVVFTPNNMAKPAHQHGDATPVNVPPPVPGRSSWDMYVVAWFWESYAPSARVADRSKDTAVWLYHAIQVSTPTPLLQQSLRALAITRYGRVNNKLDFTKQGQRIYGTALRLLQEALYDEVLMWNDETLASVRALVLYELFESTSNDPSAWYRHLAGVTTLMGARGPHKHSSPIARTVLEDIRYALMLKAFMLRKASLFGQDDWLNLPWQGRPKTTEQRLYDLGFKLAAILEKADQMIIPETDEQSLTDTVDLLEVSNALHTCLEDLFTSSCKPVLQARSFDLSRSGSGPLNSAEEHTVEDLNHLMVALNLWGCQLMLGFVVDVLRTRIIDSLESNRFTTNNRQHAKEVCDACAEYANQNAFSDLAHAILRCLPLCIASRASEFAASRTLFPLTCALWQFRHFELQTRQAMALMQQIGKARNVRFVGAGYNVIALMPFIVRDDGGLLTSLELDD